MERSFIDINFFRCLEVLSSWLIICYSIRKSFCRIAKIFCIKITKFDSANNIFSRCRTFRVITFCSKLRDVLLRTGLEECRPFTWEKFFWRPERFFGSKSEAMSLIAVKRAHRLKLYRVVDSEGCGVTELLWNARTFFPKLGGGFCFCAPFEGGQADVSSALLEIFSCANIYFAVALIAISRFALPLLHVGLRSQVRWRESERERNSSSRSNQKSRQIGARHSSLWTVCWLEMPSKKSCSTTRVCVCEARKMYYF